MIRVWSVQKRSFVDTPLSRVRNQAGLKYGQRPKGWQGFSTVPICPEHMIETKKKRAWIV